MEHFNYYLDKKKQVNLKEDFVKGRECAQEIRYLRYSEIEKHKIGIYMR